MAKQEKYLPLFWADAAEDVWPQIVEEVGMDTLRELANDISDGRESAIRIINSNPILQRLAYGYAQLSENSNLRNVNVVYETSSDVDNMTMILKWSENKQVYAFDSDFLDELLRTDTLAITRNMLDYLPYQYMYIDISANKKLCTRLNAEGFYITVSKTVVYTEEVYAIHVCRVTREYIFNDIYVISNKDGEMPVESIWEEKEEPIYVQRNDEDFTVKKGQTNSRQEKVLIIQILSYLASVEPEVSENPETKRTYRKPAEGFKPKNKFSEVRRWDVGVRFGNAVRRWKKEKTGTLSAGMGTGTKQRPHSRAAHWSHYWYNKTDEHGNVIYDENGKPEKIRRAKWVSEYYVGMKDSDDPIVIHNVKEEQHKEGKNI